MSTWFLDSEQFVFVLCTYVVFLLWRKRMAFTNYRSLNYKSINQSININETSSHINFDCITVGLIVNPLFPYLGVSSPNGMVTCTCCEIGDIEIKCPYSARNIHTSEHLEG